MALPLPDLIPASVARIVTDLAHLLEFGHPINDVGHRRQETFYAVQGARC